MDCLNCDFRISKVPAMDYPEGAMRQVYPFRGEYPRFVGEDRGETYKQSELEQDAFDWQNSKSVGQIPQVAHTYAYIDGGYGIMNEHQLAMGESTCSGRLVNYPVFDGGNSLFEMTELSRIAMERCKTARCAIQLMGDLAVEYGYYAAADYLSADRLGEAGEAMTVADTEEAWMFHILPDGTNSSAVWAAQRIPDDHIAVCANQFIIGEMDFSAPVAGALSDFLYSENVRQVAIDNDFWNEDRDGPFHFTEAYGDSRGNKSSYANRRVWRVQDLAAPSLNLPSKSDTFGTVYPFSVKPDTPISAADVRRYNRDHYEGTAYDMTQGPRSGPFGNPMRYDAGPSYNGDLSAAEAKQGVFERAISIFRTTYSFVTQSRAAVPNELGMMWFSQHAPHGSPYTPVYVDVDTVPEPFSAGGRYHYDASSFFWVNLLLNNYLEKTYLPMIGDVSAKLKALEAAMTQSVRTLEQNVMAQLQGAGAEADSETASSTSEMEIKTAARSKIQKFADSTAASAKSDWVDFFHFCIAKYHDGYVVEDSMFHAETLMPTKLFYPKWWLETVGFFTPVDVTKPMLAESKLDVTETAAVASVTPAAAAGSHWTWTGICAMFVTLCSVFYGGLVLGARGALKSEAAFSKKNDLPTSAPADYYYNHSRQSVANDNNGNFLQKVYCDAKNILSNGSSYAYDPINTVQA